MRFLPFAPDHLEWECVHFVPPAPATEAAVPDPTEPLRQAGWVLARVDGGAVAGDADLFDALAAALRFPGYFGRNWDAVNDCLGDIYWLPAPGYLLTVTGATALWARAPTAAGKLVGIWLSQAERWAGRGIPFHLIFEW